MKKKGKSPVKTVNMSGKAKADEYMRNMGMKKKCPSRAKKK